MMYALRRWTKGYTIKQPNLDCQPTEIIPEEHKNGIDMRRDMLRRSHTLIVCGSAVDEDVKNDIAVAGRLGIAATTLEGVLAVKGHGTPGHAGH